MLYSQIKGILSLSLIAAALLWPVQTMALKVIDSRDSRVVKSPASKSFNFEYDAIGIGTWDYDIKVNTRSEILTLNIALKNATTQLDRIYIVDLADIQQEAQNDKLGCYYENLTNGFQDDGKSIETSIAICPLSKTKYAVKQLTLVDGDFYKMSIPHGYFTLKK